MDPQLKLLVHKYADQMMVDPYLCMAICHKESAWVCWRARYEPNWKYLVSPMTFAQRLGTTIETEINQQSTSYGLMQIMGSVTRELGFEGYLTQLVIPEFGLYWGIKKVSQLMGKYPVMTDLVSSYNQGNPRTKADGSYSNQDYVDQVMQYYTLYKDQSP